MELNDRAMKALLDAFDRSDWQEMTITVGADTLHVSRQASADGAQAAAAPATPEATTAAPAPPAGPDAQAAPPAPVSVATDAAPAPPEGSPPSTSGEPGTGTVIESPSVGLFWRAPSPTSPPFVETGARVEVGDTVAIVEVMKLMNHVVAPVAGVVTSILVENGAAVEYGDTLMTIDPEG